MGINLITFYNSTVTPPDDALIYETALPGSGLIYGGTVTIKNANTLHVAAGHGALCGRKFTIEETDVPVILTSSGTLNGRIYIHMDLSDAGEPISFQVERAATLTPVVQQSDVNINDGIYEINLATFKISTSTISDLVNVAPYITPAKDEISAIRTSLSGKAPTSHASSATTYGVGTTANYGHNKIIDNLTKTSLTNGESLSAHMGNSLAKMVAPVQSNLTASKAYAIGDEFIYNGVLYKATAAISNGGTITIGGNASAADNVTTQISKKQKDLQTATINVTTNNDGIASTYCTTQHYEIVNITCPDAICTPFLVGGSEYGNWWVKIETWNHVAKVGTFTIKIYHDYF